MEIFRRFSKSKLHNRVELKMEENVLLGPFTTFRIGGKARYFARINDIEELKAVPTFLKTKGLPLFILGGGSNVLVSDDGFPGLVLKMELGGKNWFLDPVQNEQKVQAAAGESWDEVVEESVKKNLWGIENLSGIPGTVGGAVIQNIGAYGAELANVLERMEVFDLKSGQQKTLSNKECQFGYRHSFFKTPSAENLVIISVTLKLRFDNSPNLDYQDLKNYFKNQSLPNPSEIRQAVLEIRKKKFPPLEKVGTAGSFFKNPIITRSKFEELKSTYTEIPGFVVDQNNIKVPAAWLLDKVGQFRGLRRGDVGSFENQALVIVNYHNAKAAEIKSLTEEMKKNILEKTGIELEEEVKLIHTFLSKSIAPISY